MDVPEHWNTPEPGNFKEGEHLYSTAIKPYQVHQVRQL
jgi:hypothetical protein